MTTTINPRPATRTQRKGRILLWGKSGSGKTLTSLKLARGLAGPEGTICVIDTDFEASTLYADAHRFDIQPLDPPFEPGSLHRRSSRQLSPHYDVLVLDTGTHEWTGEGGCLEIRDREALRLKDNSWAAWAKVTPAHQRFLETLMRCPAHLIVTLRAKTVTEQVKNEKTGKTEIVDLGLFPQQRYDGEEFATAWTSAADWTPKAGGAPDHHQHALSGLAWRRLRSTPMRPWAWSWPPGSTRAWHPTTVGQLETIPPRRRPRLLRPRAGPTCLSDEPPPRSTPATTPGGHGSHDDPRRNC